jgi:hypothetical protein
MGIARCNSQIHFPTALWPEPKSLVASAAIAYVMPVELWPNDASLRTLHQTRNLFIQISILPAAALPPTAYRT